MGVVTDTTGRDSYSGMPLALAKAVGDAAPGGATMVSGSGHREAA